MLGVNFFIASAPGLSFSVTVISAIVSWSFYNYKLLFVIKRTSLAEVLIESLFSIIVKIFVFGI